MRIILDTDKKTITVPWNYAAKLDELNRTIEEFGGTDAKRLTAEGYIDDCWKYAMEHSDTHLFTASSRRRTEDDNQSCHRKGVGTMKKMMAFLCLTTAFLFCTALAEEKSEAG